MSGPKISIYELSTWQRRNLREQLKCDQQGFTCVEQIRQAVSILNSFNEQIDTLLSTLSFINARTENCFDEIAELQNMKTSLGQDCSSFIEELSLNMPVVSDKITISEDALKEKKELLVKLKSIQTKAISYHKKMKQTLSEMSDKAQSGVNEIKGAIADDVAAVSSFYIDSDVNENEQFINTHKELENDLRSLSMSDECPVEIKTEILEALTSLQRITNIEYLNIFESVTIKPLLKKYENLLSRQREHQDSLKELNARYLALCVIAQTSARDLSSDSENIELLTSEIATLEQHIVAQTEQGYISDCVNEVMADMGYDLIGNRSVTKRNGKRFRNELFSYSDGTAINVTYDAEGQIAMELGGIDRTDRVPTSDEADALCEDMESFCADFKVFEEKLKAKGVAIKSRISMSPPAAEYAAIINIDDYNITTTMPVSIMTVKGKRRKTATKQTLRKENN